MRSESADLKKRIRLGERDNDVLRCMAAYLLRRTSRKGHDPFVREFAVGGMPVTGSAGCSSFLGSPRTDG